MSWQSISLIVGIAAAVGFYLFFVGRISEEELSRIRAALASGASLVDVRTPKEFADRHIGGAINVPLSELPSRLSQLGKREQTIVVYCRSGNRSGRAARFLREQGFKQVLDLKSISNWKAAPSSLQ